MPNSAADCIRASGDVSAYPSTFHGKPVRTWPRSHSATDDRERQDEDAGEPRAATQPRCADGEPP